ncbi:MAG: hypothetical protein LKM31_10310 [Sphingobium sp.]|jgi:enolase|nr:hypothetical protein [Sphingobium sp.]
MGAEVFHTLKKGPARRGWRPPSATRAASRPTWPRTRDALDFILKSIEKAGYKPGRRRLLALDCASTEFFKNGKYEMKGEGKSPDPPRTWPIIWRTGARYPIISIEDGMSRGRFRGLEASDRQDRATRCSWSATTCS